MMRRQLSGVSRATRIACIAAVLAIAAIAVISVTGNDTGARPHARLAARNFSLRALGHPGQRVSLAAFAGRPVIINFFASWCHALPAGDPGPGQVLPPVRRPRRDHRGRLQRPGQGRDALRARGRRAYPVGVDPLPASTTTSYGVIALPQTFFLNAQHRIVKRVFGAVTMKELSAGVALLTSRPSGRRRRPAPAEAEMVDSLPGPTRPMSRSGTRGGRPAGPAVAAGPPGPGCSPWPCSSGSRTGRRPGNGPPTCAASPAT